MECTIVKMHKVTVQQYVHVSILFEFNTYNIMYISYPGIHAAEESE